MKNFHAVTIISVCFSTVLLSGFTNSSVSSYVEDSLPIVKVSIITDNAMVSSDNPSTVSAIDSDNIDPRVYQAKIYAAEDALDTAITNVALTANNINYAKLRMDHNVDLKIEYDNAVNAHAKALRTAAAAEIAVSSAELELSFVISTLRYQGELKSAQMGATTVSASSSRITLAKLHQ